MKRLTVIAVAIFPLLAVATGEPALAVSRTPSPASSTAAANRAFRTELTSYLQQLQGAVTQLARKPVPRGTRAALRTKDATAALTFALAQVPKLDDKQIHAMHGLLGKDQSWRTKPQAVLRAVNTVTSPIV